VDDFISLQVVVSPAVVVFTSVLSIYTPALKEAAKDESVLHTGRLFERSGSVGERQQNKLFSLLISGDRVRGEVADLIR
jgi:hypothetical protein